MNLSRSGGAIPKVRTKKCLVTQCVSSPRDAPYSAGASCAPDAKLNNAESDDFEIGWSDACGIVEGDGDYTIQNVEC